jgi:hypothetical protein
MFAKVSPDLCAAGTVVGENNSGGGKKYAKKPDRRQGKEINMDERYFVGVNELKKGKPILELPENPKVPVARVLHFKNPRPGALESTPDFRRRLNGKTEEAFVSPSDNLGAKKFRLFFK